MLHNEPGPSPSIPSVVRQLSLFAATRRIRIRYEMRSHHLLRVGVLGGIGRFDSPAAIRYRRGTRVICRTARGLEVGEVLAVGEAELRGQDGRLLRRMTHEDDLLWQRLERDRQRAFEECERLLRRNQVAATLVEVELLFDGRSLYFHFLGDVPPEVDQWTAELTKTYDATIRFRQFADTLTQGCGPACGTEEAAGCGDGGCSSCSLAKACTTID